MAETMTLIASTLHRRRKPHQWRKNLSRFVIVALFALTMTSPMIFLSSSALAADTLNVQTKKNGITPAEIAAFEKMRKDAAYLIGRVLNNADDPEPEKNSNYKELPEFKYLNGGIDYDDRSVLFSTELLSGKKIDLVLLLFETGRTNNLNHIEWLITDAFFIEKNHTFINDIAWDRCVSRSGGRIMALGERKKLFSKKHVEIGGQISPIILAFDPMPVSRRFKLAPRSGAVCQFWDTN